MYRYIGASNFSGWQLQKAMDLSSKLGLERFCCIQSQYNLLVREIAWEVGEVCKFEKVGLLPWSPLKGGYLSGKITRTSNGAPEGTRVHFVSNSKTFPPGQAFPSFDQWNNDQTWKIIDTCEKLAKKHNATVAQVAIRWLVQKEIVPSVVIGARTMEQLKVFYNIYQ